jgi:hypothetical protein
LGGEVELLERLDLWEAGEAQPTGKSALLGSDAFTVLFESAAGVS